MQDICKLVDAGCSGCDTGRESDCNYVAGLKRCRNPAGKNRSAQRQTAVCCRAVPGINIAATICHCRPAARIVVDDAYDKRVAHRHALACYGESKDISRGFACCGANVTNKDSCADDGRCNNRGAGFVRADDFYPGAAYA